jgi:RNA polymerase sigma-70 factor (ECF subfamily)
VNVTTEPDPAAEFLFGYEATAPVVFAYLARACSGERALAEDLTQETYSAALRVFCEGKREAITEPYLLTIARNKMIDHFRNRDRESRKLEQLVPPETPDEIADAVDNEVVRACLRDLPPMQRAVIALRFVDDLPLAEVAQLLDKSTSAVDSLQRRALANLRTMLEEHDDEH